MAKNDYGNGMDLARDFMRDSKVFLVNNGTIVNGAGNVYTNGNTPEYVSPVKAFVEAISSLMEDDMIRETQDLCCIFRLDCESDEGVGFYSVPDYLKMLEKKLLPKGFDTSLIPNPNNFKVIDFGSKSFPDWNWSTFGEKRVSHIKSLCTAYLRFMKSKGFEHPFTKTKN